MLHYRFNRFEPEKKTGNRDGRKNVAWKGRKKGMNVKNLCENGKKTKRKRQKRKKKKRNKKDR